MDELHGGVDNYINENLHNLNCTYDEIMSYFAELNLEVSSGFENNTGFHFSVKYYSKKRGFFAKLLNFHIGGQFNFDKNKNFIDTSWGVYGK